MSKINYLKSENADYIEELFARYQADPDSVDESWRFFFDGVALAEEALENGGPSANSASVKQNGTANGHATGATAAGAPIAVAPAIVPQASNVVSMAAAMPVSGEAQVSELIQRYREVGLLLADINPLQPSAKSHPLLDLSHFELSEHDLDRRFTAAKLLGMPAPSTLREILALLHETYCGSIGVEFAHVQDSESRQWLQARMESTRNKARLDRAVKKRILQKLTVAEAFERFLHTRYVAQKRFSVEGGDALIPMLDCLVDVAAELGANDVVIGMAHRGRLNVLTNIFGKKYENIFIEFEGNAIADTKMGEGDVKYHMGYSADYETAHGKRVHLSLASNPSHLEFVNPVVEGVAYAKQQSKGADITAARQQVLPVQIHGDAAFAGQGVVYETLQLSQLRGYTTGGTVHIVINNQVGFTTLPKDSRSTPYSTDLSKMLDAPVFHVNGDDAEAVYGVTQLATEFRQRFHRDIVIDLVCYRKYGHNEGDEPSFTQPLMYKKIKEHPSPREIYAKQLEAKGEVSAAEATAEVDAINVVLAKAQVEAKAGKKSVPVSAFEGAWQGLRKAEEGDFEKNVSTIVNEKTLKEIGKKLGSWPSGFTPHPKLIRLLELRAKQVSDGQGIDWGTGEALAFGSLVLDGTRVRLSGQDSERGTFSHRHSVLYDFENGQTFTPLNNLKDVQAHFDVFNSSLSETAVLGFEYGHAIADPKSLTIWEAQFGDFANGAQVIIDQFISSSESKWQRMCGLVLLLPHGYEGQGPEHSSARLERFLQMCARNNMQVCNLTTPAQIFHALRRQVKRDFRTPLIVMSPKSLLRRPEAISSLDEFTTGGFQEVIDDPLKPKKPRKLIFCTGKIYYDLAAECAKGKLSDIALVRVEQLYPWPDQLVAKIIKQYASAKEVLWVQEEPSNMGAWQSVEEHLRSSLTTGQQLLRVSRPRAAAPAVGSAKLHEKEQKSIVEEALK